MSILFNNNNFLKVICFSLLLFVCPAQSVYEDKHSEHGGKQLVFGVHSYLPSTILLEHFTPLTKYLGRRTGYDIHIHVSKSYQEHIDSIANKKVDIAFIGPASYMKLTEKIKDYPLLGRLRFSGKDTFRGAVIIRSDSNIDSLKDLKGKTFAFGDPNSTLSSLIPQRLLKDAGVEIKDLKYFSHLKNHNDVALAVLMGKYDAGGIKEEVLKEYQTRGLKVLTWSPNIPSHPIIAGRNMNKVLVEQLKKALYELHLEMDASHILQNIKKGTTAIIPANIEEYAELRQLINFK